jgi:hypothetical protein
MAITETKTNVKTFIQVTYSLLNDDEDHLLRRELHRVKDETTNDFVVVMDVTTDVGEKDDYKDGLQDQSDALTDQRDDMVVIFDDQIELIDEQITEIEGL